MASFSYHTLGEETYNSSVYNFVLAVEEHPGNPSESPYLDGNDFATIGVGFNMHNNSTVLNAVLLKILYPDESQSSFLAADATYVSNIASIVNTTWSDVGDLQSALDAVMVARAADSNVSYAHKEATFEFQNDDLIQHVFEALQTGHDDNVTAFVTGANAVPDSSERIALFSLDYNSHNLLGPLLQDAIDGGNRSEAWYQIRYGSNGDEEAGVAKRRYYESQEFGLYNPGSLDLAEARQIFQMVTHHNSGGPSDEDSMDHYDNLYGAQVGQANSDYDTSVVQTTTLALSAAKTLLIDDYAPGASIDKIWITFASTVGGTESTTLDYHTSTTNLLLIGSADDDEITGGSAADWLVGGDGADTLDGGPVGGANTVSYAQDPQNGSVGVVVNLALGSGLIDHSQKMTVAAMQMADMKVCAHRSYRV